MKPKIAVFGSGDQGLAMTADLILAGYKVNLLELPELQHRIKEIKKNDGIRLNGKETISGKVGFAKPTEISTDISEALSNINLLLIDVPIDECENRIKLLVPHLRKGQILFFNSYGCWISLRIAELLEKMGKTGIILAESSAPIYSCGSKNGNVIVRATRKNIHVGIFPSLKITGIFNILQPIFPTIKKAKSVLQTSFENVNMIVHPGIALPNIGWFDREEKRNKQTAFYKKGNTINTSKLMEAFDKERALVCQGYEVPFTSMKQHIVSYYNSKGDSFYEAIQNCELYQSRAWPAGIWKKWIKTDINYSLVPFVEFANLANVGTPISTAIIEIFKTILSIDFWKSGLTPTKLGLANLSHKEIIRYVTKGTK